MKWIKASDQIPHITKYYVVRSFFDKANAHSLYCDSIKSIEKYCNKFGYAISEIEWLDESDLPNEPSIQEEGLKVMSKKDNSVYEIWKYVKSSDGELHVWCYNWHGHHVIGRDCEWYSGKVEVKWEDNMK